MIGLDGVPLFNPNMDQVGDPKITAVSAILPSTYSYNLYGMKQSRRSFLLAGIGLLLLTMVSHGPGLQGQFIWDDNEHFVSNNSMEGVEGLVAIWTTPDAVYYPLVLTTWWVMRQLVGLEPGAYHLVNVILHGVNAGLLWWLLKGLRIRGAWLAGALFAVHPVHVQSVAWATELKNTQSGCFLLLASLSFGYAVGNRDGLKALVGQVSRFWYAASLMLYVAALLSKPSGVLWPVVALLILRWQGGQWRWWHLRRIGPYIALSMFVSLWTIWEQQFRSGAVGAEFSQSAAQRLILAGQTTWFYIEKLLWPHPLMFVYPRWSLDISVTAILPVLVLGILFGFAVWAYRRPTVLASLTALASFALLLFPVMGFFRIYFTRYSYVADHFVYLPSMAALALLAAGISRLLASGQQWLGMGLLIVPLTLATMHHSTHFHNCQRLWRDTLMKNPKAWIAHNNLGVALSDRGEQPRAIQHFRSAIRISPHAVRATYNLALELERLGKRDQAMATYRRAIEIRFDYMPAHLHLGMMLLEQEKFAEAVEHLQHACRIEPRQVLPHFDLGLAFAKRGDMIKAAEKFRAVLLIDPAYTPAHFRLGMLLADSGQPELAAKHFAEIVRLHPNRSLARINLAKVLQRFGQTDRALEQYRRAAELAEDSARGLTGWSWLLAIHEDPTARDPQQAIRLATRAVALTYRRDPLALDALAAAHAANGEYGIAVAVVREAFDLARASANIELAGHIQKRLELYRQQKPFVRVVQPQPQTRPER